MSNLHPNTSGLKPLNQRSEEERKRIQELGVQAAKKKREIRQESANALQKAIKMYIDQNKENPFVSTYSALLEAMTESDIDTNAKERITILRFLEDTLAKNASIEEDYVNSISKYSDVNVTNSLEN